MTAPQTVAVDSRRRLLLLIAGGVGLAVLLLLASRVLSGGADGEDVAVGAATPETTNTTVPAPSPDPAPATGDTVETFEVFTTKNPFVPLRSAAVPTAAATPTGEAAPAATATGGTATAAGATSTSTGSAAGTTTSAGSTTAAGGQATEPGRSTRVALLDVFAEGDRTVANVRVNDTVSKVGAGDTFASNFKVVSLDAAERCGRFLYGDDQFRMCKGEEILK